MNIVTKDWILSNENDSNFLNNEKCKIPCFYNVIFFLFGFSDDIINQMSIAIKNKGGIISKYPQKSDILIFKSGLVFSNNEKKEMDKFKEKIVTENWYERCISENKFLSPEDDPAFQINNDFVSTRYNSIFLTIADGDVNDEISNVNNDKKNERNILFLGKVFYISYTFEDNIKSMLLSTISKCNGIVYNQITPLTNYAVTSNSSEAKEDIYLYKDITKPIYITYDWIFDCIEANCLLDTAKYKPAEKDYCNIDILTELIDDEKYGPELKKKKVIKSNIFKNESFTIFENTYKQEDIDIIIQKILENSGTIYENKGYYNKNIRAKYLIVNDGNFEFLTKMIDDIEVNKNKGKYTHYLVSHRFIDFCFERGVCELPGDYYSIYPIQFKVPLCFFIERYIEIFIPSDTYKYDEKRALELLIETLGGHVDNSDKTNYAIVKDKEITAQKKKFIISKTNKNVKIILDEWLLEFLCNQNPDEANFEVIVKK